MIGSEDRTIGEHIYTVRQLSATPAYSLLNKLLKIVGPSFGALSDDGGLQKAVQELVTRMDEGEVTKIIKTMISCCEVQLPEGKGVMPLDKIFETHFHGGNLGEMFKLLLAVLEVNYADFFDLLANAKTKAAAMVASGQALKSQSVFGGLAGA